MHDLRVAALVEGHTESRFFELAFAQMPFVQRIQNGKRFDVLLQDIKLKFSLIKPLYTEVHIWFDKERHALEASELSKAVIAELGANYDPNRVFVGVPDRMVENWILADHATICAELNCEYEYEFEGDHGKDRLEGFGGTLSPLRKAELLKKGRPSKMKECSQSFARYHATYAGPWAWMAK